MSVHGISQKQKLGFIAIPETELVAETCPPEELFRNNQRKVKNPFRKELPTVLGFLRTWNLSNKFNPPLSYII